MKIKRVLLVTVAFLLIILISAALFWQSIMVYIAPKAVLTAALTDTVSQLKQRFSGGPMPILMQGLDPEGKNTVALQLEKKNALLGIVRYDMDVLMEQNPRRILAIGKASFRQKELGLSVYLDGNFAALSAPELLQGRYYGVDYGSFSEDIANNSVLRMLIDERQLRQWEENVAELQMVMNRSYSIPDLSQLDIERAILGIMALDTEVDREILPFRGENLDSFAISFELTGNQVLRGIDYLKTELPISISPSDEISMSFWLHDGAVIKGEIDIDSDLDETEITVLFGKNPDSGPLEILIQNIKGYSEIRIETESDETQYRENIHIQRVRQNVPTEFRLRYSWDRDTGRTEVSLLRNGLQTESAFVLLPEDFGFSLHTEDFEGLMHMLLGTEDTADSLCTIKVERGADVVTPEYIPFRDWSMEDLLVLIGGLGSLFGLKTA